MRIPYTVDSFIASSLFNNNFHKVKLLAFAQTKTGRYDFVDLYIKSHNKLFMICVGSDKKTGDQNIEIFEAPDIWDLRLFNFLSGKKKIYDVVYYLPKKEMEIIVSQKEDSFLKTNAFWISKKNFSFEMKKKDFTKANSCDFVKKYFIDNKDLESVLYRIKENDNFTKKI